MALGPSSWPLMDLIMNTPNMARNNVGKPPKAELGQVRSGRASILTSAQGAVRPGPRMVPLGLTGFVSHSHVWQAWLLCGHPLPSGILVDLEVPSGEQSGPQHHMVLLAVSGSHSAYECEGLRVLDTVLESPWPHCCAELFSVPGLSHRSCLCLCVGRPDSCVHLAIPSLPADRPGLSTNSAEPPG